MSEKSKIEWCDSTFNPWIGCTKVSPGCDHCYAERHMAQRLGRVQWGAGKPRHRTSAAYWRQPVRWNARADVFRECGACGWRGDLAVRDDPVAFACPSCDVTDWRPARRRVFCASLADVFDNEVPAEWRRDLLNLIADTPNLDWLVLTKRIGNAQRMLTRMEETDRWPAICDEARAVLSLANDATREPAAYLWGGCLWRTDEMGRGRPGAVELYRAQTPLTDADITALLPIWQQGSWTLPDYGRWVTRAVERAHGIKTSHNLCLSCGHSIDAHDRQYGCAEDGCDCETPNKIFALIGDMEPPLTPNAQAQGLLRPEGSSDGK